MRPCITNGCASSSIPTGQTSPCPIRKSSPVQRILPKNPNRFRRPKFSRTANTQPFPGPTTSKYRQRPSAPTKCYTFRRKNAMTGSILTSARPSPWTNSPRWSLNLNREPAPTRRSILTPRTLEIPI